MMMMKTDSREDALAANMFADALIADGVTVPQAYAEASRMLTLLQHATPRIDGVTLERPLHPEDRMTLVEAVYAGVYGNACSSYDDHHGDPDGMEAFDRAPLYAAMDDVASLAD